ncbi:MAG: amino acid adenylation domain-containing protein, partial [bacterium]|nr:amino acid adenylation domain-containing protein [bacterium]
ELSCRDRVPIGRPLGNRSLYILDRRGVPVPIGVPGELCLGGTLLARGYLNHPALTAEHFVPDPRSDERLYRTGDLARYRPDGNVEFLDRIDNQVKVRGYRIELGEIEAVLSRHPGVQQTVALVRGDRLVAYVATEGEPAPAARELRHFLMGTLPEYMVPSALVLVDGFPRRGTNAG